MTETWSPEFPNLRYSIKPSLRQTYTTRSRYAVAARFTRYPPGLASALEKMSRAQGSAGSVPRALVPLFIVNPLQAASAAGFVIGLLHFGRVNR